MPTLPPDCVMAEFPTAEVPVNMGTVPEVPLPVTVCADALNMNNISHGASFSRLICILRQPFLNLPFESV